MPRAKGGCGVRGQRAACAGCSCRSLSEPPVRCACAGPCTSCTLPLHVCGTGHEHPAHWSRTCVNVTPVKFRLCTMHAWTACCGRADCTLGMCRLSPGTIRLHVVHRWGTCGLRGRHDLQTSDPSCTACVPGHAHPSFLGGRRLCAGHAHALRSVWGPYMTCVLGVHGVLCGFPV